MVIGMNKKDLLKLLDEKDDYLKSLIKDYIKIYTLTLINIEDSKNIRKDLTIFIRDYIKYDKLERKIIKYIIKINNYSNVANEILVELNNMFMKMYNYNEWVLKGYVDMIYSKNIYKAVIPEKEFTYLNEELTEKYIKML